MQLILARVTMIGAVMLATVGITLCTSAKPPDSIVWFGPMDDTSRNLLHGWPPTDYMQLFASNAPWTKVADNIQAFLLFDPIIGHGTDADLQTIIQGLAQRNIPLAVTAEPLLSTKQTCGYGIESYGAANDTTLMATRIQRLGGTIAYVQMDEPLYYGHQYNGKGRDGNATPCHASIATIAQQAATKMAAIRSVFPNVIVGDVEPVGPSAANSPTDLADWLAAYQAASDVPLAFVDLDIVWPQPSWQTQFQAALATIRNASIPLGVIYNGLASDQSDVAWIANADTQIRLIEHKLGFKPDRAIFQSWYLYPQTMLPETTPNSTFTGLVKSYVDRN
jgi:hypothetical protein